MRIKRFIAPDMRTALKRVRDEQGPDAVILSNRPCEGGIEVVAATDYDEALVAQALRAAGIAPVPAAGARADADATPAAGLAHALAQPAIEPVDARALFAAPAPQVTAPAIDARATLRERAKAAVARDTVAATPALSRFDQMMAALGAGPAQAPAATTLATPAPAPSAPTTPAAPMSDTRDTARIDATPNRAVFAIDDGEDTNAPASPVTSSAAREAAAPRSFAAALQAARQTIAGGETDEAEPTFDSLGASTVTAPRAPAPFVLELEPMEPVALRSPAFDIGAPTAEAEAPSTLTTPAATAPPAPAPASATAPAPAPAPDHELREQSAAGDAAPAPRPLQLVATPAEDPMLTAMRAELASMREAIERQMGQFGLERLRGCPARAATFDALVAYGCDEALAQSIAERIDPTVDPARARALMLAELARMLTVQRTEAIDEGGVIALIGPTGAGKTTTAAKLAARFAARHRARDVALVTTDIERAGAREQLQAHGRRLGVTVCEAHGAEGLQQTLAQLADYPLVIVDTAGYAPRDRALLGQITWLRATANLRSLLVLPANANPHDMADTVRRYRIAQPEGVVLTKLDETGRLGAALGVAVAHDLPLAYTADGQQVPGDLEMADASRLVLALEKTRRAADNPLMTESRHAVA